MPLLAPVRADAMEFGLGEQRIPYGNDRKKTHRKNKGWFVRSTNRAHI